jgi:hypothetical protein
VEGTFCRRLTSAWSVCNSFASALRDGCLSPWGMTSRPPRMEICNPSRRQAKAVLLGRLFLVRPTGRTNLGVEVPSRPGKGNW